jgi:hypothetical protein
MRYAPATPNRLTKVVKSSPNLLSVLLRWEELTLRPLDFHFFEKTV